MRVLFDIVHPAHVHFYRYMMSELRARGDEFTVVARQKDVTLGLLDRFGIPYVSVGRSGAKKLGGHAAELVARDRALLRLAREFRPDLILTRNPAGTHVARLVGARSVFDTDAGKAVGAHFWAAAAFAHIITTPASLNERYGRRHRPYRGYKALAFLHPNRFQPDPAVVTDLGLDPGERYSIVRFADFIASHDRGEAGLPTAAKHRLIELLQRYGQVFVSSEGPLPAALEHFRIRVPPDRLLDALAYASVFVGDSQSVTLEAGLLGTPSLHCCSWVDRMRSMTDLETRYGLMSTFSLDQLEQFFVEVESVADDPEKARKTWKERREVMLAENVDVTGWYMDLINELADRRSV